MKKLLIKYACRERFDLLIKNLESLNDNITDSNTQILLSIDADDNKIYNKNSLGILKKHLKENTKVMLSNSTSKIHALNRDLDSVEWDYVMFVTDFTEVCKKGFDTYILNEITSSKNYPVDKTALSIRSKNNDGQESNHLWVVPRHFYDKNNYVFNPKLLSNYHYELLKKQLNNDYAIITININSCSIHKYVHPKWGYYEVDSLNKKSISNWRNDLKVLENYGV